MNHPRCTSQEADDRAFAEFLARQEQQQVDSGLSATLAHSMDGNSFGQGIDPQRISHSFARGHGRVHGSLAGRARVGTCGFAQIRLYPQEIKDKGKHGFYSDRFGAAELDGLFYQVPAKATFESWRRLCEGKTGRPDPYQLVPKCNDYFTHKKRLIVDEAFRERWSEFMHKCSVLGRHCPAVLMQFNGSDKQCFKRTDETHARLIAFASLLSEGRHTGHHSAIDGSGGGASGGGSDADGFDPIFVLEFRHASWYCEEVYALIEAHPRLTIAQIHHARCPSKFGHLANGWYPSDDVALRLWAGKLCYVRPHGTLGFCMGDYGRAAMGMLGLRVRTFLADNPGSNALAFFNNDGSFDAQPSCCVCDGYALAEVLSHE